MIARTAASVLGWYAPRRRRALRMRRSTRGRSRSARSGGSWPWPHGRSSVPSTTSTASDPSPTTRRACRCATTSASSRAGRAPSRGESDVTWPGRTRQWVKTSGTTAGDKMIPVTPEAFASHRRGGWDALVMAVERVGAAQPLGGPMLFLGGCTQLSAVGATRAPAISQGSRSGGCRPGCAAAIRPAPRISAIADWEARIGAIARLTARQDLRLLSGMPSWTLILFQRVADELRAAGRPASALGDAWPNLGVVIHGGVSFGPYRELFAQWIGRPLDYVEVYPASEGFVGAADGEDGRSHADGRLRHLLRVHSGRGPRHGVAAAPHRRRGGDSASPTRSR